MQDEHSKDEQLNTATDAEATEAPKRDDNDLEHLYIEVPSDLLSKPKALTDLAQTEAGSPMVVFCNSPSEADFVDAMLRKAGIACAKFIGHVPYTRISESLQQIEKREITAVVVTDVAAQELSVNRFEVMVNYSIPDDPEIYIHRIRPEDGVGSLRKVVSIINPLDFGNFHYLKKILSYDFTKCEPPTDEEVAAAQAQRIIKLAAEDGPHRSDPQAMALVPHLAAAANHEEILMFLCHYALQTQQENTSTEDHGNNRQRGRERGDRDRDQGRDRNGSRQGRGQSRRSGNDRYDNDRNQRDDRRQGRDREQQLPPLQYNARLYLGHGSSDGFSETELVGIFKDRCDLTEEQISRFNMRERYAFVDVPRSMVDQVVDQLKGAERKNGDELFVQKATFIPLPRENQNDEDDSNDVGADDAEHSDSSESELV